MERTEISQWSGILVYLECSGGQIHKSSIEMIGEASRLSSISDEKVYVFGIGESMDRVQEELLGYPITKAWLYEGEDEYNPCIYEEVAAECVRRVKPAIVLIGGTYEGRTLAPRLAVTFRTGLTADCTMLEIGEAGELVQTRPAFGGNVMASIVTPDCRPQFATVRPGVMAPVEKAGDNQTQFIREDMTSLDSKVQITKIVSAKAEEDITKQDILVVAGRGVKKKEDLSMLRELAELLGGQLASSRALVEKGFTSPKEQIGLSGHTVAPSLMITCGVSGTVQFMAGMRQTRNIIAINTDPNAAIFEIAHYPVCGDLYEIVPELLDILKKRKGGDCSET